jgi:hypothetical protein
MASHSRGLERSHRWQMTIGLCDRLLRGCEEARRRCTPDARAGLEAMIAAAGASHDALLDHA